MLPIYQIYMPPQANNQLHVQGQLRHKYPDKMFHQQK